GGFPAPRPTARSCLTVPSAIKGELRGRQNGDRWFGRKPLGELDMPDWFYHPVSRPLLFRLPAPLARAVTLGFMARLARLPLGPAVIDFLGHMRADPRLRRAFRGIDFPTAVGLGPGLDAKAVALPALARFGLGFVEFGPVTVDGAVGEQPVARRPGQEAFGLRDPPESLRFRDLLPQRAEWSRLGVPVLARLGHAAGAGAGRVAQECARLIRYLVPHVHLFS